MLEEIRKLAEERGDDPETVTLPAWRLHDLRRTAASGMARLGVAVHVVEKILNHTSGSISGVAAIYNRHAYANEMRAAAQAWANYLDGLTAERRAMWWHWRRCARWVGSRRWACSLRA